MELEIANLEQQNEALAYELEKLHGIENRIKREVEIRVADETYFLNQRISALTEANHEAALRIRELEKDKTIEIHREYGEPGRYNMIAMCRQKEWWLGNDVLMDEEETLRYPWIDFRDEFRNIRIEEFLEWIHIKRNGQYRERYANDTEYRNERKESSRKQREKKKQNVSKV